MIRPPQNDDVLAVLDFQIPCFRPVGTARSLVTNHEGRERASFNEVSKDPGRRGRPRPE